MSSKAKQISKNVKEQRSRMYMDNMYELFSLSLHELLKLRRTYRRHMRERERQQKRFSRELRRRAKHGRK